MILDDIYALLLGKVLKIYDARAAMRDFEFKMHALEEVDKFADSLSASYIQSLQDLPAVIQVQTSISDLDKRIEKSRPVTLVEQAKQLRNNPKQKEIVKLISDAGFQEGISDDEQPDLGESELIREIGTCSARIQFVHRQLVTIAGEQAVLNKRALDLLEKNVKTAEEKVARLSAEMKNLQTALAEQTSMLEKAAAAPLDDLGIYKIYQGNAENIAEKHNSIKQLRETVSTAKQAVVDSLNFAVDFESKETTYGTRYDLIKKDYAERVDPLVKSAFTDVENLFSQLDNEHKTALLKFLKTFRKVKKEEKQCQAEMKKFPDADLSGLRKECHELADACSGHMTMLHELTEHRGKVFELDKPSDETTLEELKAYRTQIERPCKMGKDVSDRLIDSRARTAPLFEPLGNRLELLPEDVRKTKIYQRLDFSFTQTRRQFALYALFQDSSSTSLVEALETIEKKIQAKKDGLARQFLGVLGRIVEEYGIKVSVSPAGNLALFDHDEEKVSETASDARAKAMCLAIVRAQKDKKDGEWAKVHRAVSSLFIGDTHQIEITEKKLARLAEIVDTLQPPAPSSCAAPLIMRFASSP